MNATEQLEKFKLWLNQADEKWLDALQAKILHSLPIFQKCGNAFKHLQIQHYWKMIC